MPGSWPTCRAPSSASAATLPPRGPMTPDDLAAQRWFRSKQRTIASVTEVERAPLGDATLLVLEVVYADDGAPERYLVPQVGDREPLDGEGAWSALVRAIGAEGELRGAHGRFVCRRTDAFVLLRSDNLSERRLKVEQSNTSVVIGDRLILKLFRLLEPGENPDLEIGAFLTDVGFSDTPAVTGAITYRPDDREPSAAAMLQELVHTPGDAWAAMLAALATDPAEGVGQAARIGEVTAAMHTALASRPHHPGFPARPASVGEAAGWRASAERQLSQAVGALSGTDHDR